MKQSAPLHYMRRQRRRSFCLSRDRYGCYYQQYNPILVKLLLLVVVWFIHITISISLDVTTTAPSQYLVMGNIIPNNEKNNGDDIIHHHDHHHHHVTFTDKADHHNNNNNTNNNTNNVDMCHDMYMTMYMDGFHWSLLFHPMQSPNVICLNYFVSTWKIQYPYEFRGCMLYTFLLAILLEALSSIRTICIQYLQQNRVDLRRRNLHHRNERSYRRLPLFIRHAITTMLYALQTVIGYLLMLIAMSYSIELFLSILFGLIVGNGLFVRYDNSNETLLTDDSYADDDIDNNIDNDIHRERSDGNHPCVEHEEQLTSTDISDETRSLLPSSSTLCRRANDGNIRRRG